MATSHRIYPDERLGVIRFWDRVDGKQSLKVIRAFFDEEELDVGYRILWDARDVAALELTPEDVDRIVALLDEVRPRAGAGRSAIVGHSPNVLTSGHLFRALVSGRTERQVQVFDDIEKALGWIEVEGALPNDAE